MHDPYGVEAGTPAQPGAPGLPPAAAVQPPLPTKTSALAITAFVLSLLFFIPFLPLVGGILGIVATVRISRRRGQLGGMGLAIAAIPTGFVIFLFTIGIYAAIAIPAFVKYARKSKSVEVTEGLDKLRAGARAYYQSERYSEQGQALAPRFPPGVTDWVPRTPCCQGPGGRCAPTEDEWNVEPWRALRFGYADPHYFQWRYESSGEGRAAQFRITARADLDCDGSYSSYELRGAIGPDGEVATEGPITSEPLE